MMNLYQQQQLQQQQQQLQQEAVMSGNNDMSMMMQQNGNVGGGMDQMFGASQLNQNQRASLGLGSMNSGNFSTQQQLQMMQHQLNTVGPQGNGLGNGHGLDMGQDGSQGDMQGRVSQLKSDIARNTGGDMKRQGEGMDGSPKRQKTDDGGDVKGEIDDDGKV